MARLKNCFFGKLISAVSQYDKKPYEDWRADYTGQEGLILLFQSMHSAPGKIFFYMMIREGKWMHSSFRGMEAWRSHRYPLYEAQYLYFLPAASSEQR